MKYQIDEKFTVDCFEEFVKTPSPVSYYVQVNPIVEKYAKMFGYDVTYDNKHTAYITMDGEDNSKTVMIGAHLDTLGLIVRRIDSNGWIRVRQLGGVSYQSLEGANVTVHTRDGREYTGLMCCESHSVHAFDDARTKERDENHMMIILDQPVKSKEDVTALGILHGDIISIDPQYTLTPNGYIKSRFIDDKAAVACCFAAIKYMTENNLKPKFRTIFSFPHYEEIGHGGSYIPEEVSEYVCCDIGLIGPDNDGDEYSVSIAAKDAFSNYDYGLTTRLIEYAKKGECDFAVDTFFHYGTDCNAAIKAGYNIAHGAFGMAVYASHGVERTHVTGLSNTVNLCLAYLLDI
ncbi:MAG: M42 family metallopeptidase [Oliverpabstia sp.]